MSATRSDSSHQQQCVSFSALQLCRDLERQSFANLHLLGSKVGECMQTAVYRLSERKEGDPKMGNAKYRFVVLFFFVLCWLYFFTFTHFPARSFKWGTKPVMELSLASYAKNSTYLWICFALWIFILFYTFMPLLF